MPFARRRSHQRRSPILLTLLRLGPLITTGALTNSAAPTYDAAGNTLTLNGAVYAYDQKNQLKSISGLDSNGAMVTVNHQYDSMGRRISSTVNNQSTLYVYDGWNVVEEHSSSNLQSFDLKTILTWGIDLSGSTQGAGGVGGLLFTEDITSNTTWHHHYDGNGNVTHLTNASGQTVATYTYDAFGNTVTATGTVATANRYRFSTKPIDEHIATTPLYYYGYRYYDPTTGRWPSRDLIGERGGVNLYGFIGNDGVNFLDKLGLAPNKGQTTDPEKILESVKEEIENLKKNGNCKDINIDTLLDHLRDKHSKENRYIYLDDYGWVDLRHFFEAANYAEDTGSVATEVLGFGNEFYQWLDESGDDYKSGFSPEDIPSNAAGAAFGDDFEIQNCCEFSKALKKFFDDKGSRPANDPKANWDKLPKTDPAENGGKNRGDSNSNSKNPGNNNNTSSVSP